MALTVDFADGFTSASAPDLAGSGQESYVLANNQSSFTNVTGLLFDNTTEKSVFAEYELQRTDSTPSEYRQSGSFIASYDGSAWSIQFGAFVGDEMIADSLPSAYSVQFQMSGGQVQYKTGNMGSGHAGRLAISIVRISA